MSMSEKPLSKVTIVICIQRALQELQSSDSQLTELQLPKNVFNQAKELVEQASIDSRYFNQRYFNHICIIAETVTLDKAVDEVSAWQEGIKAVIRYPLNLLLSPNRPELNRVKLSTPHYFYRVQKKIKDAINILFIMGYVKIEGTNDLILPKHISQDHLLETVSDLTVLHEELSIVLFVLDRVTKMPKQDWTLATLSEVFKARKIGAPSKMTTVHRVMTGEMSAVVNKSKNRPNHTSNSHSFSHPTPENHGRHNARYPFSAHNLTPSRSQYGSSAYSQSSAQFSRSEINTDRIPHNIAARSQPPPTSTSYGQNTSAYSHSPYPSSRSPQPSLVSIGQSQYSIKSRSPDISLVTSTPNQPSRESFSSPPPDDLPPPAFNEAELAQMYKGKDYPYDGRSLENSSVFDSQSQTPLGRSSSVSSTNSQTSLTRNQYQPFSNAPRFSISSSIDEEDQHLDDKPQQYRLSPVSSTNSFKHVPSVDSGLSNRDVHFDGRELGPGHASDHYSSQAMRRRKSSNDLYEFVKKSSVGQFPKTVGSSTLWEHSPGYQNSQDTTEYRDTTGYSDSRDMAKNPDLTQRIWHLDGARYHHDSKDSRDRARHLDSRDGARYLDSRDSRDGARYLDSRDSRDGARYLDSRDLRNTGYPDEWVGQRNSPRLTQSGAAANSSLQPPATYPPYAKNTSYYRQPQSTYQTYMDEPSKPRITQTDGSKHWQCNYCMQWNAMNATVCAVCNELKK